MEKDLSSADAEVPVLAGFLSVEEGGEPGREQLVRDARSDSYARFVSPQDRVSS